MKCRTVSPIGTVVAILVLAASVSAQESAEREGTAKPKLSQMEQASCLIKITCDPSTLLLNDRTVSALLSSAGVAMAASEAVLGAPDHGQVDFDMMVTAPEGAEMPIAAFGGPRGGAVGGRTVGGGYGGRPLAEPPVVVQGLPVNTVLGRVEVFSGSGEGAPEFLEAVCSRLKDVLRIAHESELENHERQMAKIENEVHEASQRLKRLQNDQQATAKDLGMVELSRQPLVERIRHFEEEQLELEMQRVSQDARRAAIEKQIQDLKSKPGTGREAAEAALRAAQAKMKLLSEKRKLLEELSKTGRAPTIEVQELEAEMIAAEAEVIRHRQMLEESAGGEMVAELNRHLAEQSIDEAERRARLEWLESKTAQLKRSLEVAAQSDYENLITIDLPLARDAYAQTRHMQAELERRIRLAQPPAVSVLGGR